MALAMSMGLIPLASSILTLGAWYLGTGVHPYDSSVGRGAFAFNEANGINSLG